MAVTPYKEKEYVQSEAVDKAQQALQLQREQGKEAQRKASREEREAEADRQFALRREKQREKHKGH